MNRTELSFVDVAQINVDYSYQRPLDYKRVERLKKAYNRGACKAVSLSRRADGSLWVYDGQHTLELAKAIGQASVPAVIVNGSREIEARWFLLMNGAGVSKATVRERHSASVTAGDVVANDVNHLLSKYGVEVARGGTKAKTTSAIGSITNWYRQDSDRLNLVFHAINELWANEDGAWTQIVIRGMWDVARCVELLDKVVYGLKKYKITPRRVLDTASGMQLATGIPGGGSGMCANAIKQLARVKE